jgi:uncharacterized SAM-binding protein YcdF (DUF218 family)
VPRPTRRLLLLVACALVASAAVIYVVRAPVLRAIGHQLVHADPVAPSDAILVLSGGVFERELEAAELFLQGVAPLVIMTREPEVPVFQALRARGVRMEPNFELRRRVLEELGVPPSRVTTLEGVVRSTQDEAEAARNWARAHGATSLLVVTSSFHTARARRTFLRVFRESGIMIRFVPASASGFDPDTWWQDRVTLREGLFEWQKALFYRVWY